MRQFKFKAWHEELKLMADFTLSQIEFIPIWDGKYKKWDATPGIYFYDEDILMDTLEINDTRLKIMQYLGEDCKDKNGKECCEGDILFSDSLYQIKFIEGIFITFNPYKKWWRNILAWNQFEIVGNIHQNPELLNETW